MEAYNSSSLSSSDVCATKCQPSTALYPHCPTQMPSMFTTSVLPAGPCQAALDPRFVAAFTNPMEYLLANSGVIRSVIQKHARDAQTLGRSLRAHLEALAGYWGGGW